MTQGYAGRERAGYFNKGKYNVSYVPPKQLNKMERDAIQKDETVFSISDFVLSCYRLSHLY